MTGPRLVGLVARREMRERSRSRAFRISVIVMIVVVLAVIIVPALIAGGSKTRDVGITGATPAALPAAVRAQGEVVGINPRIHRYDSRSTAERAVRSGDVDVVIVDARRLEWRGEPDEQLRAVITGAVQLVAVRERAAAAGVGAGTLAAILAPVPVANVQLGQVLGRSRDDQTVALVMTIVLLMAISTYGGLVLTGVVEEKATRVVEVLLARIPARTLLAGKILGIGLLGFAQLALTALLALVATATVNSVDLPAARGAVLAWAVVWFVLGYSLYATVFGAIGSLASRTEDAQSVAGPVTIVLMASYFASFASIGSPTSWWARLFSYFPATAPLTMPNRIAMSAPAWWEPLLAVALTLASIAALVRLGGRVYSGAVLHAGPTVKLRAAWRGSPVGLDQARS
jgi:ABC-2 type transport system permease protein